MDFPGGATGVPDVLLVTVDTLRQDALGVYGSERGATPWMDRLSNSGVRFETAYAHSVVTLPAHASILTGLYPQQHGVRDNAGFRLDAEMPTLTGLLLDAGFRTGAFVSAFPVDSRFGLDRGFEIYEDSFVGAGNRPAFLEQERAGRRTVELAARWLAEGGQRPSFAWVHIYEPHFPYGPDSRSGTTLERYALDVSAADLALAPLLEPILQGQGRPTLVILTSDHGEALGEHGEATHGIFAYEAALRVPLVLHHPGRLEPRVVPELARHVDILPTIMDFLSLPAPADLVGRSLLPAAVGESGMGGASSYFESLSPQLNRGWAPLHGVIHDGFKFIQLPAPELYDLMTDPAESRNLVAEDPSRLAEMQQRLAGLRGLDRGVQRAVESRETQERLRSLGYMAEGVATKREYSIEDDPKNLIELDQEMRRIGGLYAGGDLAGAVEASRELNQRRPGMRMGLLELAHLEREAGNLDEGIAALEEALALLPDDNATLSLLAGYLIQAGRIPDALEVTAGSVAAEAADVDVVLVRSLALARTGRHEEAIALLEEARKHNAGHALVRVHLGTVHLMAARRAQARLAFEEALALAPEAAGALVALAVMSVEDGRMEEASEYWRRVGAIEPRAWGRLLGLASQLQSGARTEDARQLLELFVTHAPAALFGEELERVDDWLAGR